MNMSEAIQEHESSYCILFKSPDKSVILIDIPRSIEEAQVLPGESIKRRVISSKPIETPWKTPESKKEPTQFTSSSVAITELMTLESVKSALQQAKHSHGGPWCLPRVLGDTENPGNDVSLKRKQTSGSETAHVAAKPLIPDQSHYLSGTIGSKRDEFLSGAPLFDLIVLDPPWPSRSVKRKQNSYGIAYDMQEARNLLSQIPVASHLKPDGIVAVWVTNKASVTDLLTSPGGIFSEWDLEFVGEWIWLKITSSGDPIIDLEARWRKPWERLLLGRKRGGTSKSPILTKVIMGVPDIHSRKPNLRSLFQDLLPENYGGLEVFARNLTAGWWSWGNEVLHFQQRHHWVEIDGKEQ
ncbi:hypothetical protein M426DRAFT_201450 [Hypoxylon sp. CI-4A]|nr:hypothetical protein M426DRAFT_201450 [Hypoxylon sp. CI-4A]